MENLSVAITDQPGLSHTGGSIRFFDFGIYITRLVPDSTQVSKSGAHMSLLIPNTALFRCLERPKSVFNVEGPYVGHLQELNGLEAYEYGGFGQHAVSQFRLEATADKQARCFRLEIAGALSPMAQDNDAWEIPKPLSTFHICAEIGFPELPSVFLGKPEDRQARIDRALARLSAAAPPKAEI